MKFLKILLVRSWLLRIVLSHILASYATTAAWLYTGFFMDWFTLDSQCVYTLLQAPLYLPHCLEVIPKPLKSALPVLKTPFCIGFGIGSSHSVHIIHCVGTTSRNVDGGGLFVPIISCGAIAAFSMLHPSIYYLPFSPPKTRATRTPRAQRICSDSPTAFSLEIRTLATQTLYRLDKLSSPLRHARFFCSTFSARHGHTHHLLD